MVESLDVQAGFVLTDPADPRYQKAMAHRERFGRTMHKAAVALRQTHEGEDHIDAVLSVAKAIDMYLTNYALDKNEFDSLNKSYLTHRE